MINEIQPPGSGRTQSLFRRDLSDYSGGTPGYVAGGVRCESTVGANVKSYEWPLVSNLTNFCPIGEHVAVYGRAVRATPSAGATWAACFETRDVTGTAGHQVGIEVDVFGSGPDTSGSRVGIDVTIGPAEANYSKPMEASYGVRVGPAHGDINHRVKIAYSANIECDVAFDASQAPNSRGGTALRLGAGQFISLEPTDQIKLRYNPENGCIEFFNGTRRCGYINTWFGSDHEL